MTTDKKPLADPGVQRLVARLRSAQGAIREKVVDTIWSEVPAYPASQDSRVRGEIAAHVESVFDGFLTSLSQVRPAQVDDFPITARLAHRRLQEGIGLADFLHAFRVGQLIFWEAVERYAEPAVIAPDVTVAVAGHLMQSMDIATSLAAESYLVAQQHEVAEIDRERRELLEDLLAQRVPDSESKRSMLQAAGLTATTELFVASATLTTPLPPERTLTVAMMAFRAAGPQGLTVVRRDEVVAVYGGGGLDTTVRNLARVIDELARQSMSFTMGVSTVHMGVAEVREAYDEACVARTVLAGQPGILALSTLSTFDYLVQRDDDTVRRLIKPEVRRFVEDDMISGRELIDTLLAYVAADLNAKDAASRLNLHVNTAYNRLDRIARKTNRVLRSINDVQELLIAVRLLDRSRMSPPGPGSFERQGRGRTIHRTQSR